MSDIINVAIGLVWAGALLASWSYVLVSRIRWWRLREDARAKRALMTGFASWLTSVFFAAALFASVFVDVSSAGITLRGLLFTMGLGAFTGSGILSAIESGKRQ